MGGNQKKNGSGNRGTKRGLDSTQAGGETSSKRSSSRSSAKRGRTQVSQGAISNNSNVVEMFNMPQTSSELVPSQVVENPEETVVEPDFNNNATFSEHGVARRNLKSGRVNMLGDEENLDHELVRVSVTHREAQEFATDAEDVDSENEHDNQVTGKFACLPISHMEKDSEHDNEIVFNFKGGTANVFNHDNHDLNSVVAVSDEQNLEAEVNRLSTNPAFSRYMQKLVSEEVNARMVNQSPAATATVSAAPATPSRARGQNPVKTPTVGMNVIKSPSDTTLYAPALRCAKRVNVDQNVSQQLDMNIHDGGRGVNNASNKFTVDNLSKFIEEIRMKTKPAVTGEEAIGPAGAVDEVGAYEEVVNQPDPVEVARSKASKHIIEAEQFKAAVNLPPGNLPQSIESNPNFNEDLKEDDDFFHLTCHVEPNLVSKIERGEFVELEKLLPRTRSSSNNGSGEAKTELIFREGRPVIVPHVDKSRCITGIRRWEQAFRVYAAIYSQANPQRSAEIWQYVFVINTAAASYLWSNVAEYDFAFRQMMSMNPRRSWSKTYNQMWNLCLTDHLPRNNFGHGNGGNAARNSFGSGNHVPAATVSGSNHNHNNHNNNSNKQHNHSNSAVKYCWRFNKGRCKFGASCKYINKCSYCESTVHGSSNCPRKAEVSAGGNVAAQVAPMAIPANPAGNN